MEFTELTEQQREFFDQNGYLVVRNALSKREVEKLIEAGDRLIVSERTENRQKTSDKYDGFRNLLTLDDEFIPLLTHSKTVPLIVQLLSPNIHLCTSHLIYKHSDSADTPVMHREPGWHRDIAGVPNDLGHAHIPRMEIKIAYYLTDLSEPNSGVTLMASGSNNFKEKLAIPEGQADPENVVEVLLNPGDAVLFENRTWHAGGLNLSGRTRKAVMFGYGYRWLGLQDCSSYPEALIERVDDIGKQLLDGLKDAQGRFIPGGINKPLMDWAKNHNARSAAQHEEQIKGQVKRGELH